MPLLLILLKVTLLLVAALVLTVVMQRASAGSRHLVWLVALSALLLLPVLATWGPLRWRVLPESFATRTAALLTPPLADAAPQRLTSSSVLPPPISTAGGAAAPVTRPATSAGTGILALLTDHLAMTLFVAWLVVAVVLAGWLAYGAFSVRRIVRRATRLEHADWQGPLYEIADRLGLDAAPRLLRSDDVKMPFACGLMRCTIVLPAECTHWSADRRSAVLIHELGHVRRRDLIGHTLGRFACTLYWFHPMVWTAARRLRAESERACDDLALRFGARPSDYAEHLLDIVTCVRDHATPSVALAMAHRKEFEGRMLAILNPDLRRTSFSRGQTASLVGLLALLAVVISAAAPVSRQLAVGTPGVAMEPPAPMPVSTPVNVPPAGTTRTHVQVEKSTRPEVRTDVQVAAALERLHRPVAPVTTGSDTTARAALLVQMLHDDTAAEVRRIAAWGLSRYDGSISVRRALAAALAGDADDRVREMAAWALGSSDEGDLPALSTAALGDRAEAVREVATWGLGSHGKPASAGVVAQVLGGDRTELVRGTAAWALGQFDLTVAPKALLNALSDTDEEVRFKAAWATGEIGDSTALPALRAALRRETSARVQRAQLRALIRAGEDPEQMVDWLKSKDAGVREMAARALAGGRATDPWPWPWPRPIPQP